MLLCDRISAKRQHYRSMKLQERWLDAVAIETRLGEVVANQNIHHGDFGQSRLMYQRDSLECCSLRLLRSTGTLIVLAVFCRPANLENVFRGTFRVKKRDLPAKSGTVSPH